MGDIAADGAEVAHGLIPDLAASAGQRRAHRLHVRGSGDVSMGGGGANFQLSVSADPTQGIDAADIDQLLGRIQAQL